VGRTSACGAELLREKEADAVRKSPDLRVPAGFLPHGLIPFNSRSHPGPSVLTKAHGQIGTEPPWWVSLVPFLFLN